MRSNDGMLSNQIDCVTRALQELERTCAQARLHPKQTYLLRLLAEEAFSVAEPLLNTCQATFWLECTGPEYALHLAIACPAGPKAKAVLLEAPDSTPNPWAHTFQTKITALLACMLTHTDPLALCGELGIGLPHNRTTAGAAMHRPSAWSLVQYHKNRLQEEGLSTQDGEAPSMLLLFADDVVVCTKHNQVELVVKKCFTASR